MMKILWLIIIATLVAFTGCNDNTVNPKIDYEIGISEFFQVDLVSNPSTGNSWHWVNRDAISVVDTFDFKYIPDQPQKPGSGGKELWKFKGRMPGTATIRMTYNSEFDPTTLYDIKTITVKVK